MATKRKAAKKPSTKKPARGSGPSSSPCAGVSIFERNGSIVIKINRDDECQLSIQVKCSGCTSRMQCQWNGSEWVCSHLES